MPLVVFLRKWAKIKHDSPIRNNKTHRVKKKLDQWQSLHTHTQIPYTTYILHNYC